MTLIVKCFLQRNLKKKMANEDGLTPLHSAVLADNLQQVKHELNYLKQQNKSLNSQNTNGRTSLLLASFTKNTNTTDIVKLLVEEAADVNISDYTNMTPLHAACQSGQQEVSEILLQAGACVNAQTNKLNDTPYDTPLHLAVRYKHYQIVNLLLQAGADTNIQNCCKEVALFCGYNGLDNTFNYIDETTSEKLVSKTNLTYLNSRIPSSTDTLLQVAVESNNIKLTSILIQNGVDVSSSTLQLAADYGHGEISKMILEVANIEKTVEKNWSDLLIWASCDYRRVGCLYYVMKASRVILDYRGTQFDFLEKHIIDRNVLEVDVLGITKILFELGAVFLQEDLEAFILLCSTYERLNCAERKIDLFNLFVENNVDISPSLIYFSMINHPQLTLKLLQYCIKCDPIDIFKHFLKCNMKPVVPLLNLIKDVLKFCSPYCGLRFRRFLHLQLIKDKEFSVRTSYNFYLNKIKYPWFECVQDSETNNDVCEEVLDLLYRYRVPLPTLVELSRNKIRQQLRLSCKNTKSYLQNLKSLPIPRIIVDIIQCKANINRYSY